MRLPEGRLAFFVVVVTRPGNIFWIRNTPGLKRIFKSESMFTCTYVYVYKYVVEELWINGIKEKLLLNMLLNCLT